MNKRTPRSKTPSLIGGSNGRPSKVKARKVCKCSRCEEILKNGSECIEIPQLRSSFSNNRRVCFECYEKILKQTQDDLDSLKELLPSID